MHITWHGFQCVKLQTEKSLILINPFQDSQGITMPKLKVDIVLSTNLADEQSNNLKRLQGAPKEISMPGEYEISGVFIYGLNYVANQNFYIITVDGMTIAHPGKSLASLTDEQLDLVKDIDILFLPIANSNAKQRSEFISELQPRLIIPIQYKLDGLEEFAKEMGVKDVQGEKKVIIKPKDLPQEETQVIILQVS
ncbi:MAG: hypothetical protein A2233_03595 [Candidatus Kerfeldbacteria bacterium RIFOXYA2_FULL_38_24]|uniref:Lactamase n=1 Tax=Candidatus Kerfeldbacteria bacterium RIFOXYB2_FULL_38_14 TaxID=1798547 RepID=A0A1G2BE37_9BACT|nr:MAG: hypothetical protein A2233_03595 [Candidatus Kerfeldbacteria bacterium RIFOXYA2_FULL_38_24]OGY87513.1 MAG: hypothetical protein A2319_04090 [Candidatus Kerfeldbacteria bacterium RIFOXYB2_FULL_38_14]OGY90246.1 MAG: hypothetical protein A2458_03775 [Candidatus Kerfeldbacteria bacterium RIFOXYC2_FULL_38_9]